MKATEPAFLVQAEPPIFTTTSASDATQLWSHSLDPAPQKK